MNFPVAMLCSTNFACISYIQGKPHRGVSVLESDFWYFKQSFDWINIKTDMSRFTRKVEESDESTRNFFTQLEPWKPDFETKVVFASLNSLLDILKWLKHWFSDFLGRTWPDLSSSKKKFWKFMTLKKVIGKMKVVFVFSTKNIN